jgi:hypothetical protein
MVEAPQFLIESKMREFAAKGSYDMVQLFSSEGLPLAEYQHEALLEKDSLLELSLLFRELREKADVMDRISNLKEMIVEGNNSRKIVFRFFKALGDDVALVLVIPPKKAYKAQTNMLVREIEKIPS